MSWGISIHIDLWRVDPRSSDFILEVTLRENHTVSICSMFNMNIGECWIMYLDGLPDLCQTTVALLQRSNSSFFIQGLHCRLLVNTILAYVINSHMFFAIFKDKGLFTVPLHGWYAFSSLLKDILYETAKCIWKCPRSTCHLLLATKDGKIWKWEGNAQSTLKDENYPRRPWLNASQAWWERCCSVRCTKMTISQPNSAFLIHASWTGWQTEVCVT